MVIFLTLVRLSACKFTDTDSLLDFVFLKGAINVLGFFFSAGNFPIDDLQKFSTHG